MSQHNIIVFLKAKKGWANTTEIMEALSIKRSSIQQNLAKLLKYKFVEVKTIDDNKTDNYYRIKS